MAARRAKFLPRIFEYYFNNVNPNRSHLLHNKNTVVVIVLFIDIDFFFLFLICTIITTKSSWRAWFLMKYYLLWWRCYGGHTIYTMIHKKIDHVNLFFNKTKRKTDIIVVIWLINNFKVSNQYSVHKLGNNWKNKLILKTNNYATNFLIGLTQRLTEKES